MGRFVYGLDPASKDDYFGVVCHELPREPKPVPRLRAINKLRNLPFDKIFDYLVKDMFIRLPPSYIVADYSNEKTFSDLLIERFGKEKVELVTFSNANKLMLKEDGLSMLRQNYRFPNPDGLVDATVSKYVKELISQLQHEQILATRTGKTTFDHPPGSHNDLAIAWELSVHGCLRFMNMPTGPPIVMSWSAPTTFEEVELYMEDPRARVKENVRKRMEQLGIGTEITNIKLDGENI